MRAAIDFCLNIPILLNMKRNSLTSNEVHTMKNAVIYSRVSSLSQEENTSLDMQVEKGTFYAATYDLNIVETFSDVSTGKNTKREGYQAMLKYIEENQVDSIIVYKLDRLHRNLKTLLTVHDEWKEQGISIVSVSEQIDTSTSHGKLFFQIVGSFGEFEGNRISERVSEGKQQKIEKELFTAGRVPFGFEIEHNDFLLVNEAEAAQVKEMFRLKVEERKSVRKIAVAVFNDVKKYGQVAYILKNPAYKGKLRQENKKANAKKDIQYIDVPRIVSAQLWNKANKK